MHANPAFRKTPTEQNLDFARARGLGGLSVNGADGPVMAHVPFLLAANGTHADLHLARSNAIVAPRLPCRAVLAVSGPDAYISPDWDGVADQVPTWNHVAVHLRGELTPLPFEALEPHSNALSDDFEARPAPKPIWNTAKMTDGVMARMMRTILPFRLTTTGVEGTWKLSPNKTAVARLAVGGGVEFARWHGCRCRAVDPRSAGRLTALWTVLARRPNLGKKRRERSAG